METTPLRIYLAGRMCVEAGGKLLGPETFPGQQGRLAFAYLVANRTRPVTRSELAEALWPERLPSSWDAALSAIVSKLRGLLSRAGLDGPDVLLGAAGYYELRLPDGAWVDLEAAVDGIHDAEAALKAGEPARAYGPSAVAHHIARRPFLPGEEGPWVERLREKLAGIQVRALECRAEVYLWNGEFTLAAEAARDAVALEPFRESAYRRLMRAQAAAGNTAEALRTYERCRQVIAEELGVHPSRQTREVYREVLQSL